MLSPDKLMRSLLAVPLFVGVSARHLKALMLSAERVTFADGERLIVEGQLGEAAFVVVEGSVVMTRGHYDLACSAPLPPGTLAGELAMLIETTHEATVVASGPVKALMFKRSTLLLLMAEDPALAEHFVERFQRRLADMAVRLREFDAYLAEVGGEPLTRIDPAFLPLPLDPPVPSLLH